MIGEAAKRQYDLYMLFELPTRTTGDGWGRA
jgi:hypothetical protein